MRTHQLIAPSKKILRHPSILEAIKAGRRVWPVNVEMDLSDACNLKCTWCAFAHLHGAVLMDVNLARDILHQLAELGAKAVTFSGGGEPTCNLAFPEITGFAFSLGLQLGLYTNGYDIKRLLPVLGCFTWVYVSLDAASKSGYQAAKGVDGFERVCDNIRLLAAENTTTLGAGFLLNNDNWRLARQMAELRHGLGVNYVQFRPVVGLRDYRWVPITLATLDELEGDDVIISRQRFLELYRKEERRYTVCRGSELTPCIGADGTLWVCPNTRGLRPLGDLKAESFRAIWERRPGQVVGPDCRAACRNHFLNETLDYVCAEGPHDDFV